MNRPAWRPAAPRRGDLLATLLCLAAWLVPGDLAAQSDDYDPLDRIVAIVNEDVILASELAQEVRSIREQLRASDTPMPSADVLDKQVLERLILTRVQVQAAERAGLRVDEDTLNRALDNIARQNNVSLAQFRDVLERDGYRFATFRERVRSEILMSRIQQTQVQARVNVPEREVDNFLATEASRGERDPQVRVAQILFALPDGASPEQIEEARERALEVVGRLDNGEDFAELAVTYSDGRNALDGGDLGWKRATDLPVAFATAIRALRAGEYSDLVRTTAGFHIVKVLEARDTERHVVQQVRARHILIQTGELANEDEVIARLAQLRERAIQGEDFGSLARSNSEDRGSALRDGDLGWLNPGDTVPDFEREMTGLAPGEVSQPFRTQFGWHIVEVMERRDHDGTDSVRRTRAREAIRRRKGEEELQSWVRQLRDEAYVELRLDSL